MAEAPKQVTRIPFARAPRSTAEAILLATPMLLDGAREYADYLQGSYRGFNVGNGSLAIDEDAQKYYAVFGANYKAGPDSAKVCAERVTVERASRLGLKVVSFHVDAELQSGTHGNHEAPTTHPCGICREGGHTLESDVVADDVTIVTRRRDTFIHQVLSANDLDLMHSAPEHYADHPAHRVINDPDYAHLESGAIDMCAALENVPDGSAPLATTTVVRLSWAAGLV